MKNFVLFLFFVFLVLFIFIFYYSKNPKNIKIADIVINNHKFTAEVLSNPSDQAIGLSGRKSLKDNQAMLFEYKLSVIPYFWMKGMLIPIDIIWISDNKIVGIEKNISNPNPAITDAALPKYKPNTSVNYVLEINSGLSDKYGFNVGDFVEIIGD